MAQLSPQTVYDNLDLLDRVDVARSAHYRQQAIEILSDLQVSLSWRQAIASRLDNADHLLAMQSPGAEDNSY
jgi:Fe2+ or Zn2+ uptake regulation protein